jgi:hypothetical protein
MARPKKLISSLASGPSRWAPRTRARCPFWSSALAAAWVSPTRATLCQSLMSLVLLSLLARAGFVETHPGKLGDGEHGARHAAIVRRLTISLEEIGRHHLAFESGHRRERCACRGGGVARGIDPRVGDTLQELVDHDSALLHIAPPGVETLQRRTAPRPMHHEIRRERLAAADNVRHTARAAPRRSIASTAARGRKSIRSARVRSSSFATRSASNALSGRSPRSSTTTSASARAAM